MKRNRYNVYHAFKILLPTLVFGIGLVANANAQQDYGDLVFLNRDVSGVPILDGNSCQQPIAFESDTCPLDCTGQDPCLVPLNSDAGGEENPCEIEAGYEACTKEVEFGRLNVGRAPDKVFERQLEDVKDNLTTADCQTLDPAGRMVATRADVDLGTLVSTIDSPLQNLAIYHQLMLTGNLGFPLPQGADVMATAARGLGTASGKGDEINVDVAVYLNQILGLSDPGTATILDPKICIDINEEVQGVMTLVEKCFLDYSAYSYARTDNFSTSSASLPAPAYMPETSPAYGVFEYLALFNPLIPTFSIEVGPILDAAFCVDPGTGDPIVLNAWNDGNCGNAGGEIAPGFVGSNIGAFAQTADDTRAVINFMHTNPAPVGYETLVPCTAAGELFFPIITPDGKAAVIVL